jgi:hypothetical protein
LLLGSMRFSLGGIDLWRSIFKDDYFGLCITAKGICTNYFGLIFSSNL